MTFLAPAALWGLMAVPFLLAAYVMVMYQRSATRSAAHLSRVAGGRSRTTQIVPPALMLLALAGLLFSFARPVANVSLPVRTGQIVLAFDTSNSMVADDVEPSRIDVAKSIAQRVVDEQPRSVQLGVVAFTNGGQVVQAPTTDEAKVREAIDRLTTDGGTSIGEGIFSALTSIADRPIEIPDGPASLDIGYYSNAAIIVFTDGEDIGGADPVELAALASNAGVPVYTVGIGTPRGTVVALDGFSIATALDEPMLTEIAEATGGSYFLASDDPSLTGIFDEIDRSFERQGERIEITSLLALLSMLMLTAGGLLSMRWTGRLL